MSTLVSYITIEDVSSGLFRTQIVDLLKILATNRGLNFELIVINVPWKHNKNKLILKKYEDELKNFPIEIKYYPFLPPMRYCCKSSLYLFFTVIFLSIIIKFVSNKTSSVFHCRSYITTLCVNLISNFPVIFDMRSLWVLENISAGNIVDQSLIHKFWIMIEKYCLKSSFLSTGVSQGMIDHARASVRTADVRLIPIAVDTGRFFYENDISIKLKEKFGITNQLVVVYSGSFGLSEINIPALSELIKKIHSTKVNFKLIFITNDRKEVVRHVIKSIPQAIDSLVVSPPQKEINAWLSIAHIGIHALPWQLDSNSRLGTKVVEYWSNGLPVIVNEHVGDAVGYIKNNDVGIVSFDTEKSLAELKRFVNLPNHRQSYRQKCREVVSENFEMVLIADKYIQCYSHAGDGQKALND